MSNFLITGVAGFIASRICDLLLQDGHTVFGVDNLTAAYDVRMKQYRLERLQAHANFKFAHLDISDKSTIEKMTDFITTPAAVINLAAIAGVRDSVTNPWLYMNTNTVGTLNMLEFCRINGVKKFILASTSGLYGNYTRSPHDEEHDTNHPLQPYAASKKSAEVMAHAYHFLHDIDVTIFRYFTVFGPAGRPDMSIFRFCQWIAEEREVLVTGDGEQSRGFTYLDDIARGTILGLKPLGYEVFNLGGHEVKTINQVIHMLEDRLAKKARICFIPINPADILENVADVTKAKKLLGWQQQVSFEEGMDRLVEWYLRERSWAKDINTE